MGRDEQVAAYVADLANADTADSRSVNIYLDTLRRRNLTRWLQTFHASNRSTLFVGEAPGKFGAALTGIPFVSPHIAASAGDPWNTFGPSAGYDLTECVDAGQRERTATRFWKHVSVLFTELPRPLTWNVYPFWPYTLQEDGNKKNRTLQGREIEFGKPWLARIIEMHPDSQIVAVGVKAFDTLQSIGIDAPLVPHPSRGSDERFIHALEQVAAQLDLRR